VNNFVPRNKTAIIAPLALLAAFWVGLHLLGRALLVDSPAQLDAMTTTPAPSPPAPPPIVDYVQVFAGMREARDERALLERLSYGNMIATDARAKQIEGLVREMETLPAGSPQRAEASLRLDAAEERDAKLSRAASAKLDQRRKSDMVRLFQKIEGAVSSVAAAHGFSAPPATTPAIPSDLNSITLDQLRALLLARARPLPPQAPDTLTREVLELLDSQYAAGKREHMEGPR
jgi:hypothetical protein